MKEEKLNDMDPIHVTKKKKASHNKRIFLLQKENLTLIIELSLIMRSWDPVIQL